MNWTKMSIALVLLATGACLVAQEERKKEEHHATPPARHEAPQQAPQRAPASQPAPRQQSDGGRQSPTPSTPRENPGRTYPNATPGNSTPAGRSTGTYTPPARTNYPSDRGRAIGNVPQAQRPSQVAPRYSGGQAYRTPSGAVVQRGAGGQVREIRTAGGAVITHGPAGVRTVEVVRPGNRVVVATYGGRAGYVQRPLVYGNQRFVQRTYFAHGATYVRVYRPAVFGGVVFNVYTPVRYYRPGFYAWAWNPWPRPVIFSFGWGGAPWYGYYGGYFAPYPVYPGPLFWLTDYMIGATLRDAYYNRIDAGLAPPGPPGYPPPPGAPGYPPPGGEVALTPDVKQAIADEVHRQLDMERAESQNAGAPSSLNGPPVFADGESHVFVAYNSLIVNSGGQECTVSEGDVLQLTGPPAPNAIAADVAVLASKPQDCRKGALVSVNLQDLQEMQNHMRETVDQGLADLQSRQGNNGVPPLGAADRVAIAAPYAAQAQPDPNAATQIGQVAGEADRAEQEASSQPPATAPNADTGGGPVRIAMGMTIDQVEAVQGPPQKVIDLGSKKIYVYSDIKITFSDGRVSDVQ